MKKNLKILKKIIYSVFLIYGYNLITYPLNLIIPINIMTVLFIVIFGPLSLLSLIIIKLLIF